MSTNKETEEKNKAPETSNSKTKSSGKSGKSKGVKKDEQKEAKKAEETKTPTPNESMSKEESPKPPENPEKKEPESEESPKKEEAGGSEKASPAPEEVRKFAYGRGSERRMDGVDVYLTLTAYAALDESTELDWGVGPYGGLRKEWQQNALFKRGASKVDGITKVGMHQLGKALDLVPYKNGKYTWETLEDFLYIKTKMFKAWNRLKKEGHIPTNLYLHWGGFWKSEDKNKDGKQQINELGWDLAHFEVRTFKQKTHFRKDLLAA